MNEPIDHDLEKTAKIVEWLESQPDIDSEQDKLNEALAQAQAEMPNATLNKVNPHFHSKYADLASIRDATLPSLTKYGLSIRQFCENSGDGSKLFLVTRLGHKSGQYQDSRYPIALDRPQAMGSALTYARRYNWAGMCGVGFEEDDDAEEAMREKGVPKTKAEARTNKDYEVLESSMRECQTQAELKVWRKANATAIDSLPVDWAVTLGQEYRHTLAGLPE